MTRQFVGGIAISLLAAGRGRMRLLLTSLAVAALMVAASANAAAPERTETKFPGTDVLTMRCGFPVLRAFEGRSVTLKWTGEDGTVRQVGINPTFRVRLTNPATSETIVVNATGPVFVTQNPDGSFVTTFAGPTFTSRNPETGELGLFSFTGRAVIEGDASGQETETFVGHVVDLCAELANP